MGHDRHLHLLLSHGKVRRRERHNPAYGKIALAAMQGSATPGTDAGGQSGGLSVAVGGGGDGLDQLSVLGRGFIPDTFGN